MNCRSQLFVLFSIFCGGLCNVVKRSPSCVDGVCEFDWVVDYKFTMMWYNNTSEAGPQYQPIGQGDDGFIRRRSTTPNCTGTINEVTLTEFKELVSTGDGDYRLVYAINGQIPGPEIVVTEGDMVAVRVHNRLQTEGVSFHWHGLLQRGTPWMDGVPMVSQCPILPGQVFQYRFIAEPVGTHWYHAHSSALRNDGLSGAFIVLPKQPAFPQYFGEFFAVVQDWTKRSATETTEAYRSGILGLDDYGGTCHSAEYTPDGAEILFPLNAGLVNGRGQRYSANGRAEKPFIPLETFTVKANKTYRFRIINAGFALPFEIYIEKHQLYVVALDGNDVEQQKCDAVVISPGESTDILVVTNQRADNYNIHFKTLSVQTLQGTYQFRPKATRAILNYEGVNQYKPSSSPQKMCTHDDPCYIVNQIYGTPPLSLIREHINLMSIRSTAQTLKQFPVPTETHESRPQEFFFHFHIIHGHPAINGKQFVYPSSALQTYPTHSGNTPCNPPHCTSRKCKCTHTVKLETKRIVQLVLFSRGLKESHPIHFHGHQFHVVKVGYPYYNPITGLNVAPSPDIRCHNHDCSNATWMDPSWHHGIPDLNLKNPPVKDTVNIPMGGYVVIRFSANNPGYWLLHSQLGHHQSQGMSMIIQEGDQCIMALTPPNFPTCGSFESSKEDIEKAINDQKKLSASQPMQHCEPSSNRLINAICRIKNSANQKGTQLQQDSEAEQKLNEILFGDRDDFPWPVADHAHKTVASSSLVDAIQDSASSDDFLSISTTATDENLYENEDEFFKSFANAPQAAKTQNSTSKVVPETNPESSLGRHTPSIRRVKPISARSKNKKRISLFDSFVEEPQSLRGV